MSPVWKAYQSVDEAAAACAAQILSSLEMTLKGSGIATLALSGGSTPKLMFAHMLRTDFDWSRVHVFQVDERSVPPDHQDSNYRMTREFLLEPAHVPQRNVHRIQAELEPAVAARHYINEIREVFTLGEGEIPHFDVVHLGVGSDGHTASLFPGEKLIEDREGIAASVYVEKLQTHRITLLPQVLLSARQTVVLAAGEDKAEPLREVLTGDYRPLVYPAQIVAHHARRAGWFFDASAARLL